MASPLSAPYRDQHAFVRQVEQHVGIALALLEQYETLSSEMLMHSHGTAELAETRELARTAWQGISATGGGECSRGVRS